MRRVSSPALPAVLHALALLALSLGCGGAASVTDPSPVRTLAGQPMTSCTVGSANGLCGTLVVPEDRGQPGGRGIGLRVALLPATGAAQPDALFLLAGGPGQAATTDLAGFAGALDAVRRRRDIVLVDQRGTGGSNLLRVPQPPDGSGLAADESTSRYQGWLRETLQQLPGDVRFYTTSVAADDLDAVRAALGYEAIDLYGGSYGATAAQYYMRQYPARVRAVVLDGGTLLDVPISERAAAAAQRALELLFARCAKDAGCAQAFPDFPDEFAAVLARLERDPVETTTVDPRNGRPIVVEADDFVAAAHQFLLQAESASALPYYVHQAFLERWDRVVPAALAAQMQAFDNNRLAMAIVITCSEAWARFDPGETARLAAGSFEAEFQVAGARARAVTCGAVPRGLVPANDGAPPASTAPVLLLVGEADPQDPPENVAGAARLFADSLTVVVPGHGHCVAHRGCLPTLITRFLEAGTTRGLDVSCATGGGVPLPGFKVE